MVRPEVRPRLGQGWALFWCPVASAQAVLTPYLSDRILGLRGLEIGALDILEYRLVSWAFPEWMMLICHNWATRNSSKKLVPCDPRWFHNIPLHGIALPTINATRWSASKKNQIWLPYLWICVIISLYLFIYCAINIISSQCIVNMTCWTQHGKLASMKLSWPNMASLERSQWPSHTVLMPMMPMIDQSPSFRRHGRFGSSAVTLWFFCDPASCGHSGRTYGSIPCSGELRILRLGFGTGRPRGLLHPEWVLQAHQPLGSTWLSLLGIRIRVEVSIVSWARLGRFRKFLKSLDHLGPTFASLTHSCVAPCRTAASFTEPVLAFATKITEVRTRPRSIRTCRSFVTKATNFRGQ